MTTKIQQKQEPSTRAQENRLADELQLTSLLKQHPDFLLKHPELLAELQIPHATHGAASLIERQVELLRDKLKLTEQRLRELMDIARDNERLSQSRHRLALNLLGARELDDIISCVLNELGCELKAEFAVIKLISKEGATDQHCLRRSELPAFSTMLQHKNPVCGRSSDEQKALLFGEQADKVASAAIIPLVAGADLGLLGLGSSDPMRFHATMGTDFLRHIGELISAALAVHGESQSESPG